MATYFVASGGSNTSPYDTWAKAATSLQTAMTAASSAGDIVVIQYDGVPSANAEQTADTTYSFSANITILSASNDGGSSYTPTAMGTANWIGNSTANRFVRFSGADRSCLAWGLTFRTAGSTNDNIVACTSAGQTMRFENCYFWASGTMTGEVFSVVNTTGAFASFTGCTFRFGATGQNMSLGQGEFIDCTMVSSSGSTPTTLFNGLGNAGTVRFIGCDFSQVTGTLFPDWAQVAYAILDRCKLGSGVTVLAAQTSNPTRGSASVTLLDCASGDTHGFFGHYDAQGSCVTDTGIYFTSGAAGQSWKIVTTANAVRRNPYVSPPIDLYWDGTSAITPYIEILRDGSTTAFTDAEIWVEIEAKTTSGNPIATAYTDRLTTNSYIVGTAGADQADGAGLGSWTGESGTAKSMKLGLGSSITPAEVGSISARIYVAAPSITVYVDPQIRT